MLRSWGNEPFLDCLLSWAIWNMIDANYIIQCQFVYSFFPLHMFPLLDWIITDNNHKQLWEGSASIGFNVSRNENWFLQYSPQLCIFQGIYIFLSRVLLSSSAYFYHPLLFQFMIWNNKDPQENIQLQKKNMVARSTILYSHKYFCNWALILLMLTLRVDGSRSLQGCGCVRLLRAKGDGFARHVKVRTVKDRAVRKVLSRQTQWAAEDFRSLSAYGSLLLVINHLAVSVCVVGNTPAPNIEYQVIKIPNSQFMSSYNPSFTFMCLYTFMMLYHHITQQWCSPVTRTDFSQLSFQLSLFRDAEQQKIQVWRHEKWHKDCLSHKTVKVVYSIELNHLSNTVTQTKKKIPWLLL